MPAPCKPCKDNCKDNAECKDKCEEDCNAECSATGAEEVGARGIAAESLYNLSKDLDIIKESLKSKPGLQVPDIVNVISPHPHDESMDESKKPRFIV